MSTQISTLIERATHVKYSPFNINNFQTVYELAILLTSIV